MYFEGCANPHLGATILLRGGSQTELKKVKNVTSMMIFAAYSWRLEKSFLMDEFARPPSPKDNPFLDETCKDFKDFQDTNKILHAKVSEENDLLLGHCKEYTENQEILKVSEVQENSGSVSSDKLCLEIELSLNEGTPIKDIVSYQTENMLCSNSIKQISSILSEDIDPYDTLKLFKPKTKSSVIDEKAAGNCLTSKTNNDNLNNSSNLDIDGKQDTNSTVELFGGKTTIKVNKNIKEEVEKSKIKDKVASEEKRIYGESISDRSDPLHQYLNEDEEDVFSQTSPNGQHLSVADLPLLNKFKKALEGTILSVSPYLKFSVPYLETETGRNCILRSFFPREIFYSVQFMDKVKEIKTGNVFTEQSVTENPLMNLKLKPQHPFVQARLTTDVDSRKVQALLANFRACGSRLYPTNNVLSDKQILIQSEVTEQPPMWPDCLDPASHQRLSVLFCSFSHTGNSDTPAFCVNPWVVNMDLYGRNDIALGRFLERYCLTSEYKCPAQACRAQIAHHIRRFAHDGGCIYISLSEMSTDPFSQENANQILMWSKCMKCKSVSPVVPMSDDTWSLSFAKYLELRFHGSAYTRRGTDTCQHSLHHDHYQYFTKKNMLAVFKYTKISQWEISLPPPVINIMYDPKQHADVIEEMKSIALKGDEVFSCIREKLTTLQTDIEILNVKQQLSKDQQYFKNKIEEIQLKLTSPTLENKKLEGKVSEKQVQALMFRIEDGIVILKRIISEVVFTWNANILEMSVKKKDERPRRFTERSLTTGSNSIIDTDGYITEDTASESQLEDLSPMSADYNAVDAIAAAQNDLQGMEGLENSDNEVLENNNPEDIVIIQESPKMHQRSHSDVLPITFDDMPDKKKKKKTILSQLLPSVPVTQPIVNPLGTLEHHLLPLGFVDYIKTFLHIQYVRK